MNLEQTVYWLLGWKILASTKIEGKDVVVVDKGRKRELVYDHVIHSRLYKDSVYTGQYWDYFTPIPSAFDKPKVLIIGLGGGTIPFQMEEIYLNKVSIDIVEINKEMVYLSEKFLPRKLRANIKVGDGFAYLSETKDKYDVIISDGYIGETIPGEFFEEDYIRHCYEALHNGGVLAINYAVTLKHISKKYGLVKKLKKRFKVYSMSYPHSAGNIVLICVKKDEPREIASRIMENFPKDAENQFLFKVYSKVR